MLNSIEVLKLVRFINILFYYINNKFGSKYLMLVYIKIMHMYFMKFQFLHNIFIFTIIALFKKKFQKFI